MHTNADDNAKTKLVGVSNLLRSNGNIQLGLIFMEMRDGFETVSAWKKKNDQQYRSNDFVAMTGEVLNRLHNVCRVTHGDLHQGNILINTDIEGYYKPLVPGNILLIDWGRAKYNDTPFSGSTPIPMNEAIVEQNSLIDKNYWSYKWLQLYDSYSNQTGLNWNASGVDARCLELKKQRPKNYSSVTDAGKNIPGFFYQPNNFKCGYTTTRSCEKL
jgi:hypothetical protein